MNKTQLAATLTTMSWVKETVGVPTQVPNATLAAKGIARYTQAVFEISSDGTQARIRPVGMLVVNDGTDTENAYWEGMTPGPSYRPTP